MERFRLDRAAVWVAAALLGVASWPAHGLAQMTRGSMAGVARDTSGAVVPGVTVTVTSQGTGATQTTLSDIAGFYRVPALEPGVYSVRAELAGFRTVERQQVDVRTSLETPLDLTLEPAAVGETVQVTAEPATAGLNKTNGTIAATIGARAVQDLPLSGGRNVNSLMLIVPNASANTGQGGVAINGNRPRNNNYMIDGSDNNDITVTVPTAQIVPEAIAEYQVIQSPYGVEFGRNSGGQVNVITRSGTNRLAGDVFDYYQASGLNSRTNIEKVSNPDMTTPARLIRHQLGGDVGGPIVKDKLFFFGLYQRDTQRRAQRPSSTTVRIPTAAGFSALSRVPLREGQPAASRQAVLQRLAFLEEVYAADPAFRNVSNTLVNGVPIETGQANLPIADPSLYHTSLVRADFHPWPADTFTVRYSRNDLTDEGIAATGFGSRFMASQDVLDANLAISNTHIISPSMLNESRFSVIRRDLHFPEVDPDSPTATVTGLFQIGGASNFPTRRLTNTYQLSNTLTWTAGRHGIKAGADIRFNDVDNATGFHAKGTFTFNNLQDFMNNSAFRIQQALQREGYQAGQWQSFFFVQDDLRVREDLTVNLGLRYEVSEVPLGMFGATDAAVRDVMVPAPARKDTDNWAPRVGFSYSPRGGQGLFEDGRTVFRGGFGIAYDVLFYNLLTANAQNYPRVVGLDVNNVLDQYPNRLQGSATPTLDPLAVFTNAAEDTENPESRFYSLTMQREMGDYLLEVGYSGSRGAKGINQIHRNPATLTAEQAATARAGGAIPPLQARRLFPQFGVRTLIPAYVGPGDNDVEAKSEYHALYVAANRRLSQGVMFSASYTFSRWTSNNDASLGEGSTESASQRPQDMFDYASEWSRSVFDRPHRLAVSYIWEVPGPRSGILGQVLGGWQLSGITSAQSGRPFTILTGVDSNGDANTGSDRPNIDPSGSFVWDEEHRNFVNDGYYVVPRGSSGEPLPNSLGNGDAPRNSERTAGFWNTDLALMKRFEVSGSVRFTARIDAFNAFNQDNYGGAPGTPVSGSFGNMNSPSFGQNTNNWGRRIVQLSGKVSF